MIPRCKETMSQCNLNRENKYTERFINQGKTKQFENSKYRAEYKNLYMNPFGSSKVEFKHEPHTILHKT